MNGRRSLGVIKLEDEDIKSEHNAIVRHSRKKSKAVIARISPPLQASRFGEETVEEKRAMEERERAMKD